MIYFIAHAIILQVQYYLRRDGDCMDFSLLVKAVRKEINISQQELAAALGINFTTINRWENGHVQPSQMGQKCFYDFCEAHAVDLQLLEMTLSAENTNNE